MKKLTAMLLGPPKVGKTENAVRAFAKDIRIISAGTGTDVLGGLAIPIKEGRMQSTSKLTTVIAWAKSPRIASFPLLIDDLTSIAKRTYEALRNDPKFKRQGADKYGIPNTFNGWMADLLKAIEARPGPTIITAWNAPPEFEEETGALIAKGTIELPGKQWQRQLPGSCNLVANVVFDDAFAPRSYVYDTSPNPHYVCGDRILGTRGRFPQSLSLVLWGAGRTIEWPVGLEWFDEAIPPIMDKIIELKGNNEKPDKAREVLLAVTKAAIKNRKVIVEHQRWLLLEAHERAWWRLEQRDTMVNEIAGIFPDETASNDSKGDI